MVEEVQGKNCLTNFHGMNLTRDKLCSMVKKWQTLIEANVDVKTSDGYLLSLFCIGFTKKRQNQIKIIVPNSTAGMIIGKGGAYVKEMKERSGAFVQLSQKQDIKLPQRVVTIVGEAHGNRIALEMILDKIEAMGPALRTAPGPRMTRSTSTGTPTSS